MKSLVSILIPAYNAQEFLAATITSALGQTWARKEVIIVNDGSRDETLDVARRFESASVKVITHENQGAAATRNKALSLAQGEFIQWLDADDLLGSNKITCQMEAGVRCSRRTLHSSCSAGAAMWQRSRSKMSPGRPRRW